jgi:hypothetical protein
MRDLEGGSGCDVTAIILPPSAATHNGAGGSAPATRHEERTMRDDSSFRFSASPGHPAAGVKATALALAATIVAFSPIVAQGRPTGTLKQPRADAATAAAARGRDSAKAVDRQRLADTASAATAPAAVVCADGERFPPGSAALCISRGGVNQPATRALNPRGMAPPPGEPGSDTVGRGEAFPSPWKSPWTSPWSDSARDSGAARRDST